MEYLKREGTPSRFNTEAMINTTASIIKVDSISKAASIVQEWLELDYHDGARLQTALSEAYVLQKHNMQILSPPPPPYCPDLTSCDFWLFLHLKKSLRGRNKASLKLRGG